MPYALCPMPYALCPVVPHLSEKGYMLIVARTPSAVKNSKIYCTFPDLLSNCDLDHAHS